MKDNVHMPQAAKALPGPKKTFAERFIEVFFGNHRVSSHAGGRRGRNEKAIARRRVRNRMARESRRINRR